MITLVTLALLGVLADETQTPAPDAQASVRPPPAVSTADSVVAAAFKKPIDTPAPELKGSAAPATTGPDWTNLAAPALAIVGLAALAFAVTRRRRAAPGSIRILESASLGPKRSLVIAEVLGERLVLGVSEAGVSVLMTRPLAASAAPEREDLLDFEVQPQRSQVPEMTFFQRLMGKRAGPRFEDVLGDSIEDQELRAKLAAGIRGTVP
jgi:flagellar biogenesis protein FliO